ncbi:hypothetical protein GQ42DRAFT_104000, partial [Ramicandelaber brevisporus]
TKRAKTSASGGGSGVADEAKVHNCPTCKQSFLRSHDLNRHMKIHVDMKPYRCIHNGCSKQFARVDAMKRH